MLKGAPDYLVANRGYLSMLLPQIKVKITCEISLEAE